VEGVETQAQSDQLNSIGIQLQQGYHLAMPQPLSYYLEEDNSELIDQ